MLFSERLVQLRRTKGWNQERTAKEIGVTKRTIHSYETGTYPRKADVYKKIGV